MAGLVYALDCNEVPLVKIGWTNCSAESRAAALQPWSPVILRVLWARPGSHSTEERLHRTFADRRRHGEWFDFSDENAAGLLEDEWQRLYESGLLVVGKGASAAVIAQRVQRRRLDGLLSQDDLAKRAGVSMWTVHRLENKNHGCSRLTLQKVARALGMTAEELAS